MNGLDIALVLLLTGPAVLGAWKGLAQVVIALIGIWTGFVVAPWVKDALAPTLEGVLASAELAALVAYACGFLATFLAIGIVGLLVNRSLKKLDLAWVNRLAGGAAGLLAGLLVGGILVAALESVAPRSQALQGSLLAPPIGAVTRFLVALHPEGERVPVPEEREPPEEAAPQEDATRKGS